ncbi:MAG: DUF2911 domain-containing protein [Bacteroidota bacterium]
MKLTLSLLSVIFFSVSAGAQMDLPPSGNNPRATVSEEVGITSITIKYSRPDVNKREVKIWGDGNLVTYGFTSNNLNTNKNTQPWRAGANENTIITFEHDVKVEGKDLKAGTYGLHMAIWPEKVTIIFSNQSGSWGSFYYDEKFDALRVDVKPVKLDKSVEYLKYEFIEHKPKYCVIAMQWEMLSVPFKVEVDVDNIVIAKLRDEVTSQKGFNAFNMLAAANYCINNNVNLPEALAWAKRAASTKTFNLLSTLSNAYAKNNMLPQADSAMNEALALSTNANQYLGAGRSMITAKRLDRAGEIFDAGQKKYADVYAVNAGYMYYYSAKGDFVKALEYANKALMQASEQQKIAINANILKLKDGKDIN